MGQGFGHKMGLSLDGQNKIKSGKGGIQMNFNDLIKISKVRKMKWIDHHIHDNIGGGIYRFYNINKEIIYVGKSVDLHRRLHQHYSKSTNTAYFIDEVVKHEVILENNPIFQTLLEGIFIAYHQPKYNDEVKDSKKENDTNDIS
jgi:hypothetical protein